MKHFTLLSLFLLSFLPSIMAYDVTTEIQKKNVLIEEFTGIHCGYCPQAHVICHNLEEIHQGKIFSIAVHSGYYAVPASDQPDYRTADGDEIDAILGTTNEGRPCGIVNRRTLTLSDGTEAMILGRSMFGSVSRTIIEEDAPVNLLIKADCDASTRVLNVTVEGYCTAEMPSDKARLSIAMTQDNIVGPQNGSGVGDEYVHQSMLRDYLTPVLGDEIEVAKGQYFSKSYTYTLPEKIVAPQTKREVELLLQDINLLAFVTEDGKNNVMNIVSAKPKFTNLELPLSADLSLTILGKSKKYGFNYLEVILANRSNEVLSSAQFELLLNGETQVLNWEGEIAPLAKQIVKIPYDKTGLQSTNTWTLAVVKLNEKDAVRTELSGSFSAPTEATTDITIAIQTDAYSDENIYRILDEDGNVIHQFDYPTGVAKLYKEQLTLQPNKAYCFEIIDLCADGISRGSYKINNADGKMIEQNYAIPDAGYRTFFATTLNVGTDVENLNSEKLNVVFDNLAKNIISSQVAQITLYSVAGKLIVSQYGDVLSTDNITPGVYILTVVTPQEKLTQKIIVK